MPKILKNSGETKRIDSSELLKRIAFRTAFISRLIVLRESKRSKSHRDMEDMTWEMDTSAEEIILEILEIFKHNREKLSSINKDIKKALQHAHCSLGHFTDAYVSRATTSFRSALDDYKKSNEILFESSAEEDRPKDGGWRL